MTEFIPDLPRFIDQVDHGNTTLLTYYVNAFYFDSDISDGMQLAVMCSEDAPYVTTDAITTAAQALDPSLSDTVIANQEGELAACHDWHVAPVAPRLKTAVKSELPTLVLEGEYDPITPPANGDLVAQTLLRSHTLRFPGTGHGIFWSQPCAQAIARAFWSDPTSMANTSCLGTITEPAFI